jgi:hypothetical protein
MVKAKIYCLCLHDELLNRVKELNYIPVGLGNNNFSDEWMLDKKGINISNKNSYYGEYSFHYWIWKNELDKIPDNTWIGFCAYRRFWQKENKKITKKINLKSLVLNDIPIEWENYDVILGDKINIDGIRWMKILKYGKKALLRNPAALFKKGHNIRFQFDMFHGIGILDKAIELLNDNDRESFREYVNKNTSYNQGNMFICKSKKIINQYYKTIFEWLEKCEKIFGFNLEGYGNIRIYAFLAERFLPYWFNKNSKVKEWPILFHDLKKDNLQ